MLNRAKHRLEKSIQFGRLSLKFFVLSTVFLIVFLALVAVLRGNLIDNKQGENNSGYGFFLDTGLLDFWELKFGRAKLSIQNSSDLVSEYSIYVSKQTKILKAIYLNKSDKTVRQFRSGDINEIKEGVFVEIYLHNPYVDTRRSATTIIYWE